MKVKFNMSLCGGKEDLHAGNIRDVSDEEAISLIDAGIATAVNKKDYESAKERILVKEQEQVEKEQKLQAIMYEDELKAEKERLLLRIEEIDAILTPKEADPSKKDNKEKDSQPNLSDESNKEKDPQ